MIANFFIFIFGQIKRIYQTVLGFVIPAGVLFQGISVRLYWIFVVLFIMKFFSTIFVGLIKTNARKTK